jgi:hypothetical protein
MYHLYVLSRVFISCSALVLLMAVFGDAQIERISLREAARNPRPVATSSTRAKRPVTIRRVDRVVVTRTEMVRVSNLTVTTVTGAKVILESILKTPKAFKRELIADAQGNAIFDDLRPGDYKVVASKDDYEPEEVEKVTINPQKAHGLNMDLKALTYKLKIDTNLTAGDVFYAPAIQKGKNASGSIISEQLGNYCVVKIQPNGEAVIPDLKKGYYDIDIRPDSLEFQKKQTGINIPDDIDQDDTSIADLQTFQIEIAKNISRETFSTVWIPADWNMPSVWSLDKGMKVKDAGIALPQNPRFRYYVDFEMLADVKLRDDGTLGFVLRAEDPKNYYLLEISGSKGTNPYTARLYSIKNGVSQFLNSATTVSFAKTLTSANGFRAIVRGDAKGFTVWIEDSDTGKTHAVGLLTDQYNTYQKGAVGIAGAPKSNFEVNFFTICTPTCPR